ncbi:putative acetyltransferase [Paenibacillus phyllosphaerae]|uniref:Putative acetyltransferase n=1 Tax=Paenibacillus phyllosphaerae TaxID=274593 RepID=A0A7W5AZX5_9BACL|nr:GNAT family N-acetyltransferase [Paenibacillus phyllosphaerae]MBB3111862.1 putative acetyltransferase [Paenibacillus phyllosphaerae]
MEEVYLAKPTAALQTEYMDFYEEWVASGETMVPWVISQDPTDFAAMLQLLHDNAAGVNQPDGWVPSSTFWLVTGRNRIVGAVNIRHRLTEWLVHHGGHIGYGIRPSERRKGYATKQLALALIETRRLGINRALVICDAANTASERTILRNGGIQDADFIEEDGNVLHRFWIEC